MSTKLSPALRESIENTIRGLTVDAVEAAGIGHLGAPMGLARPVFQLWDAHLRFDPDDPAWPLRDRFVLSAGHASMLLYALLHLFEAGLTLDEIRRFRQLGSRTPGHPEFGETAGVEVTTGPLGQGVGNAVGMALAGLATKARFAGAPVDSADAANAGGAVSDDKTASAKSAASDDKGAPVEKAAPEKPANAIPPTGSPGEHFIYAVAGDGDLMEGVSYEACSLAGHLGLGNLIVLYDDNRVTIDGSTELSFSEDVEARFTAQGWHVQRMDGEDVDALDAALHAARAETSKPSLLILRTTIGKGSGWAGQSKAHGGPFGEEEAERTRSALGIPEGEYFHVPAEVRAYLAERTAAKRAERAERDAGLSAWRKAQPAAAAAWERVCKREFPPDLTEQLLEGMAGRADATRKHSGEIVQRLARATPGLWIGGSADLAGSNNTTIKEGGEIGRGAQPFAGANIHFGVREHAMGAIANGIALDGVLRPFAGTFLVFSDYMRPSLRLAALMKLRSVFVFTHDSIFVGEDGPTHQPVEHVDALRAIPGLTVFRPADGVEVAMAWAFAARAAEGPVALCLTRQGTPALTRPANFTPEDVWKGGYLLCDTEGAPDLALVASGSEVALAADAAALLRKEGLQARVVSLPSLERLYAEGEAYIESLLPRGLPVAAVEAGVCQSLRGLAGRDGLLYGRQGFGASAPWQALAEHFGFVPEKLAAAVRAWMKR